MTVRKIRQSELRKWKRCRRSWNWSYRLGLDKEYDEPKTSDVGTLYHAGLQAHYSGVDPLAPIHAAKAEHIQLVTGELPKDWNSTYELAQIMVEGYIQWAEEEGIDADYRILHAERRIEIPFADIEGDQVIVTGQLDLEVLHVPTGIEYLWDNKSVQSLDQAGRQLQVDDQLLTYAVLKQMENGTVVGGAGHNCAKRVKRTAAAKPPFYARVPVTFNETQLANHRRHMLGTLGEIVRAYQWLDANPELHHDIAPPNPTKDCDWDCAFISVCPMADDGGDVDRALRDPDLFVFRERV